MPFNNVLKTSNILSIEGLLNIDKPLNVSSLEIARKTKEKINKKKIFSYFFLNKGISGCLVMFFQKSGGILSSIINDVYEIISVIKIKNEGKSKKEKLWKCFKENIYQSYSSLSNRHKIKFVNIKFYLENNFNLESGVIIYFFKSDKKISLKFLNSSLGLIFRKNFFISEIRQIKIGFLTEDDNIIIFQDFIDTRWNLSFWRDFFNFKNLFIPIQFALRSLKRIIIKDSAINSLCYGSNLRVEGILAIEENFEKDQKVLLVTKKKEIIAIGKMNFSSKIILKNSKGIIVILKNVLMEKNRYPKKWAYGTKSCLKQISSSMKTF